MNVQKHVLANTILAIPAGSRLYGTVRPNSDYDLRGVCLMPQTALLGLDRFEQWQPSSPIVSGGNSYDDCVVYGLNKFVELALNANPNILDILFAPPKMWLRSIEGNDVLQQHWNLFYTARHCFLSQKVRYSYAGYALSQLKRIMGHWRWIANPPSHIPTLEEYGGTLLSTPNGGQVKKFGCPGDQLRYEEAATTWKQYQRWLAERNPQRAALEKTYGYDTKHASHLVRLLLQVQDILREGDFSPVLTGQTLSMVMSVLRGEYDYDSLVAWAKETTERVEMMDTALPKTPNRKRAEAVLMSVNLSTVDGMTISYV